ncbi:MAG: extracellular solute-binding protein, partial [Anaerolineales bacterium]
MPPDFDPNGGSLAATILQTRFEEFAEQHPLVRVVARVKAEEGSGGLLVSLLTASVAAPLALPDLILLPHTQLSAAADGQALFPLTGLTETLNSDDWYDFAQGMAQVNGSPFGLPFAGDALILAYRPTALVQVPSDWAALLESGQELGFAAADPDALFTLTQLISLDINAEQDDEELAFSQETLMEVFEFFALAHEQGVLPFWLNQYQTSEQSWQAFSEGRVPMVAAWTSRIFDSRNVDVSAVPLPAKEGQPFALVNGWVWAITTSDSARAALVAELAEFLTTPEFIAQWTAAAGLLPPRHSSLAAWTPGERQTLASQIVELAAALPNESTLNLWG